MRVRVWIETKDDKVNRKCLLSLLILTLAFNLVTSLFISSVAFVKATDGEKFAVNYRLHEDGSKIWVLGEVINNLTVSVRKVVVKIVFLDSNQAILKEVNTTAWLSVIMPGRRAAFGQSIEKQSVDGFTEVKVEVASYEESEDKPPGIDVPNASLILLPEGVLVTGNILNTAKTGDTKIDAFMVTALFYDDKGFLTADITEPEMLEKALLPGETHEFKIAARFANESSNLKKYILTAESFGETEFTGYAITHEIIALITKNPPPDRTGVFYQMILILWAVALVPVVIIAVKKWKRKPQSKRPRTKSK